MSANDPEALLLGRLDGPVAPDAAFADALLDRLLGELERRPRRLAASARTLILAAALALVLAGIATGTYLVVLPRAAAPPRPGALTVVADPTNGAKIVEVLPNGRLAVVWHCPGSVFCGDLSSVDWAPDGGHVAFTLDEIGGRSAYIGLHILNVRTGRDLHIPDLNLAHPMATTQPSSIFKPLLAQEVRRLGCTFPVQLSWSPDSRRLAYACGIRSASGTGSEAIFSIRSDGTGRRRLRTGFRSVGSPSWSPDGKRMAFTAGSSIYVIGLDGSGRRLVARDGDAPDWSPDGRVIAYEAADGIRLVTPDGRDVTPGGRSIAPKGVPAWSPDGSTIAVATSRGVFLVDANGTNVGTVTGGPATRAGLGVFGPVRPAWYPGRSVPRASEARGHSPSCTTCF